MKKESFPTTAELTFYQRSASRRINLLQYKLYVERRSLETQTRETSVFVLSKSGGYRRHRGSTQALQLSRLGFLCSDILIKTNSLQSQWTNRSKQSLQ